jgi:hypothetical protein
MNERSARPAGAVDGPSTSDDQRSARRALGPRLHQAALGVLGKPPEARVRFGYLAVRYAFSVLRLLPMSNHEKDIEILALRHQLGVLQRQLAGQRPQLRPEDRVLLAALLVPLARATLRRLRLVVTPDTEPIVHSLRPHLCKRYRNPSNPSRPDTVRYVDKIVSADSSMSTAVLDLVGRNYRHAQVPSSVAVDDRP